jgi:hypothetical protein
MQESSISPDVSPDLADPNAGIQRYVMQDSSITYRRNPALELPQESCNRNNTENTKEKHREDSREGESPFPFQPPPKTDLPEHKSPADQRVEAILEICGLSASIPAHINQAGNAAVQLRDYSAMQILARYGPDPPGDGGWHWYSDDWRGQRGDMPTPAQVVETIAKRRAAVRRTSADNGRSAGNSASARLRAQIDAMENDNG